MNWDASTTGSTLPPTDDAMSALFRSGEAEVAEEPTKEATRVGVTALVLVAAVVLATVVISVVVVQLLPLLMGLSVGFANVVTPSGY